MPHNPHHHPPPPVGGPLDVRPDLSAAPWDDIDHTRLRHGGLARIGLLPGGVESGAASVALLIRLDDGRLVLAQTTWKLLRTAVRAIAASPAGQQEGGRP